ncbi:MAG TPA: hypothetical protein VNT56_00425 [Acidimicrobiales bacterium]|nr:hypothetical protein [Acidimicrobiales bacterium]
MTTSATWHAGPDVLARFANDPAAVDGATAASLESHLVACAQCRAEVARLADPALAVASWDAVADRTDRPRLSLLEQVLQLLGARSGLARLAAATPGLRLSGVTAVGGLTAAAVAAAYTMDAGGPFLLIAPLVPLAAVALTFAAATDPAGEAGVATPVHGAGLAMRRAAAVLVLAFAVLGLGAVALPELGSAPLAWVLPAAALAVGSLALGTWVRLEVAVAGLAATWMAGVGLIRVSEGLRRPFDEIALFTATGQGLALAVTVAAGLVLAVRADRYATMEARR